MTSSSNQRDSHPKPEGIAAELGYDSLEKRHVLSATFLFSGGELVLNGFDAGQDLTVSQTNSFVNGTVQDTYLFDIASGSWTGDDSNPLIELESVAGGTNNRLEVATSFFGTADQALLNIDGSDTGGGVIQFFQDSFQIEVETIQLSNFANDNQQLSINAVGDIELSNVTVTDSNPADGVALPADLVVSAEGNIRITGDLSNEIVNSNADIIVQASGSRSDIILDAAVSTDSGSIRLVADDSIFVNSGATIESGNAGSIAVAAGADSILGDGNDRIQLADGSLIQSDAGTILITTSGVGDIHLGRVVTNAVDNAVRIEAGNSIIDNTADELSLVSASNGRVELIASDSIGGALSEDIDIQAASLSFDTTNDAHITDIADGVTIDRTSRAGGGLQLASASFIDINANLLLGASSSLTAENSSLFNDNITLSNSVINLTSTSDATLNLTAGDDILLDGGTIITSGSQGHIVNLVADNESNLDSDRGSITNTAGTNNSITTNQLNLRAHSGIGESEITNSVQPLRVAVDQLTATNTGTNGILIEEQNSIELVNMNNADGAIEVTAGGSIKAVSITTGESETVEDNSDDISLVALTGNIDLVQISSADDLLVQSQTGNILDSMTSDIQALGSASFVAENQIELTDGASDVLVIGANATFDSRNATIGQDGLAPGAGTPNVSLGSVTFDVINRAILTEDDTTLVTGTNRANELFIASPTLITNAENTELTVTGHSQFNANSVDIGRQINDSFIINSLGTVSENAYFGLNGLSNINAEQPDTNPLLFGSSASQGTTVAQTLFVDSTGAVTQQSGILDAESIGIRSTEHVHLSNLAERVATVAIDAGNPAILADPNLSTTLNQLGAVENSEVRSLPQSIAFNHLGDFSIGSVGAPFGNDSIAGLHSSNGSILVVADGQIEIQNNVTANSFIADPQATVYSRSGNTDSPAIEFSGGAIQVNGPTNLGVVNAVQTFANFFDANGFVFEETTTILVLNPDGSADQDIHLEYGHAGETGYRVGIVWDELNLPGQPVEIINTFVSDPNVQSEAFEDAIYQNNPSILIPIQGNEGGFETLRKVEAYSKEAIIAHNEDPKVFSTVTVRNDQDINLFSGNINTVNNGLNETRQQLEAELDSPKRFVPNLPKISEINPIEIKSSVEVPITSTSPEQSTAIFLSRNVQPFESGEMKWIRVDIPINEMEEIAGELRLKNPTSLFPISEGAELNEFGNDVGENEVEKLIKTIELDSEAEAGYWYKVFKDYENRNDELFFYHYKTGELIQPEIESLDGDSETPGSDGPALMDQAPEPNETPTRSESDFAPTDTDQSSDAEFPIVSAANNDEEANRLPLPLAEESPEFNAKHSIVAAAAILAGTNSQRNAQTSENDGNNFREPKLGRLDRIKRRILTAIQSAQAEQIPD